MLSYINLLKIGDKTFAKRKNILDSVDDTLLNKITEMQNMVSNVKIQT